jgi:hypothetical protein
MKRYIAHTKKGWVGDNCARAYLNLKRTHEKKVQRETGSYFFVFNWSLSLIIPPIFGLYTPPPLSFSLYMYFLDVYT